MASENTIESRLLQFIAGHGLHDEQPLPEEDKLRKILDCTSEELHTALDDMENHGLLKRHDWGWSVLAHAKLDKKDSFSLSKSALLHGHRLDNKVIEKEVRLPLEDDGPMAEMEKKAQCALGLAETEPFIVLARIRRLSDTPSDAPALALHRVYLRPDRFPPDFLTKHDFEQESLTHIYRQCGYKLTTRDTFLQARLPNLYEKNDLKNEYDLPSYHPVLAAEQALYAETSTGEVITLEFLQATYLNWTYEIKHRPA